MFTNYSYPPRSYPRRIPRMRKKEHRTPLDKLDSSLRKWVLTQPIKKYLVKIPR